MRRAKGAHMSTAAQTELLDADGDQLEIAIPEAAKDPETITVPHELIEPDPMQPRKEADQDLRAQIARGGLIQDITVRKHPDKMGHYMIVDGERRWRSAAGVLHAMRCKLRDDLSASVTERLTVQLMANTGKSLTPLEEAQTYRRILAENPQWTVSDLAKRIGQPRSTVAQRLEAMELGAWLEDVATGAISWTMLVEMLLPYRGCPDAVHAKARERAKKAGWWRDGESPAIGPRDFERAVRDAYKPALYPLNKAKVSYGDTSRPAFNTKHHDAECNCGGMLISDYDGASPRKYCGNPSWWGPLHRKALKDKPKTSSSSPGESRQRATRKELRLPKGSIEVTGSVHEAPPDGCAWVTDAGGTSWAVQEADGPAFDPIVLQKFLKPTDLVLVRGTDAVRVATMNLGAMKKAQSAFVKDVDARQAASLKPLRASLKKHGSFSGISGLGVQSLLATLISFADNDLEDVLRVLCVVEEIARPDSTEKLTYYEGRELLQAWAKGLSAKDAKAILTDLAALGADNNFDPAQITRVSSFERKARAQAADRKVPWLKAVADTKSGAPARPSAADDDEDEPEELVVDADDDLEGDDS